MLCLLTLGFGVLHLSYSFACSKDLQAPSVPIMVGGTYTSDNCTQMALTRATVRQMKAELYLAVRNAPNIKSVELERIKPDYPVIICTGLTNKQ